MQFTEAEPESADQPPGMVLPTPKLNDDPLASKLDLAKLELAETRNRLLDKLQNLQGTKDKIQLTRAQIEDLARKNQELENEQRLLESELQAKGRKVELASLSLEGLRRRGREVAEEVKKLQALPAATKELKYHAPVSRAVSGDELFFECRGGRVAFIDMPAFMHEIRDNMDDIPNLLRKESRVRRITSPVGAFRLQYTFEREQSLLDSPGDFRYGMSGWVVEPVLFKRGESLPERSARSPTFTASRTPSTPIRQWRHFGFIPIASRYFGLYGTIFTNVTWKSPVGRCP